MTGRIIFVCMIYNHWNFFRFLILLEGLNAYCAFHVSFLNRNKQFTLPDRTLLKSLHLG